MSDDRESVYRLVIVRHGESLWNRENRFTGWTDVDLTEKGKEEAVRAGKILRAGEFEFDVAWTSVLKRAIRTLWIMLDEMDRMWVPVEHSWRLNERHYGELQGNIKSEMAQKLGEERIHQIRRSFECRPPELSADDARYPGFDPRYHNLTNEEIPRAESLKETVERVLPCWENNIVPMIKEGKNILIVAHWNTIRGLEQHWDNLSDEEIINLEIPTGVPFVYEFDEDLTAVNHYPLS